MPDETQEQLTQSLTDAYSFEETVQLADRIFVQEREAAHRIAGGFA